MTLVERDEIVELAVTDRGPGIDPAVQDELFERYHGDDHGLGLALVRQVAEAYGGVSVESPVEDGRGARFVLRFPTT